MHLHIIHKDLLLFFYEHQTATLEEIPNEVKKLSSELEFLSAIEQLKNNGFIKNEQPKMLLHPPPIKYYITEPGKKLAVEIIEENKRKQAMQNYSTTYNQTVGTNYGSVIQGSDFPDARISPTTNRTNNTPNKKATRTSALEYAAWIAAILSVLITIFIYFKIWPFK